MEFRKWVVAAVAGTVSSGILAQGSEPDVNLIAQRVMDSCPTIWEDIKVDIDPVAIIGDVWQADTNDRNAFIQFIEGELQPNAPDISILEEVADDLASVAAECATQRLSLLNALINKLPNDALAAMAAVSEQMQAGAASLGQDGFLVGDIRMTGRPQAADGWVFLAGQTIGNIDSGADLAGKDYFELFELAKTWAPNTGDEDFEALDNVILPDTRGRAIAGLDNMNGISADVITDGQADTPGGVLGSATHTLTTSEMPSHSHSVGSGGSHSHSYKDGRTTGGSSLGSGGSRGDTESTRTTSSGGNHSHSLGSTGGGQPHPIMQPTIFFNVEMKYK